MLQRKRSNGVRIGLWKSENQEKRWKGFGTLYEQKRKCFNRGENGGTLLEIVIKPLVFVVASLHCHRFERFSLAHLT
jgi:hypothetical protein